MRRAGGDQLVGLGGGDGFAGGVEQILADGALNRMVVGGGNVGANFDGGGFGGYFWIGDEDSAAGDAVGEDGVGDVQAIENLERDVSVEAGEIGEIEFTLGLAGGTWGLSRLSRRTMREFGAESKVTWGVMSIVKGVIRRDGWRFFCR